LSSAITFWIALYENTKSASWASTGGGYLSAVSSASHSSTRAFLDEDGHGSNDKTKGRDPNSSISSISSSMSYGHGTSSVAQPGRQLLYQGGEFTAVWRREYGSFKSRWHPAVLRSVSKAEQQLNTTRWDRSGRLFVPMLTSRHKDLCCMLTDLNAKLGATNKVDVFVFSVDNAAQTSYNQSPCVDRTMNIALLIFIMHC
jgi:hypothetical protein